MATTKKKPVAAAKKASATKKTTVKKPVAKTAAAKKPAVAKKAPVKRTSAAAATKTTVTQKTTPVARRTTSTAARQTTTSRPAATPKPAAPRSTSTWQGVAGLVLALCALIFCWIPVLNVILAVLALIFGIMALKTTRRGMGIASIIIAICTLLIALIITLIIGAAFNFASKEVKKIDNRHPSQEQTLNREGAASEVDAGDVGLDTVLGQITTGLIMNTTNLERADIELISANNLAGQETLSVESPAGEYFALLTSTDAIVIKSAVYEDEVNTVFDPEFDSVTKAPSSVIQTVKNVAAVFEENTALTFVDPSTAKLATSLTDIDQADASYIIRADGYAQYTLNSVDGTQTLFVIIDNYTDIVAAGYSAYEAWN